MVSLGTRGGTTCTRGQIWFVQGSILVGLEAKLQASRKLSFGLNPLVRSTLFNSYGLTSPLETLSRDKYLTGEMEELQSQ